MFEPYRKTRERKETDYKIAKAQDIDLSGIENITIEKEGREFQKEIVGLQQYLLDESTKLFVAKVGEEVVRFGKSHLFIGKEINMKGGIFQE